MPKRIALLHFSAPPIVGGVESVIGHHAHLMAEAGHKVIIIAGRGGGSRSHKRILFHQAPLIDSRHPRVMAAKAQLDQGCVPADFEALVEQIERELTALFADIDIVIAHNVCSLHKNLALTAALRRVCAQPAAPRLIAWHHDLAWTTPRYQAELHEGWPWNLIREEWTEVRPQHVAVSELRRRELAALLQVAPETIAVVPSGLDVAALLKLERQTAELVQRLQLLQAEPLLLLPVRITRRKNIELAIRMVAALAQTHPRAALIVTGPPGPHNPTNNEYFAELKALRASLGLNGENGTAVHFLAELVHDYLPDEVIGDFYRLADALFFPSYEEGFGIPMLEAGLTRLPIFCSDILPLREIAGERATYFDPDNDPVRLAHLVGSQLEQNTQYHMRLHIRHHYTWDSIYAQRIAPLIEGSGEHTMKA